MISILTRRFLFAFLVLFSGIVHSQILNDASFLTIKLKDQTTVALYSSLPEELRSLDENGDRQTVAPTNDYYYLPTNLRLAQRPDGVPEFLFTKFTTENSEGVSGAIMHFLMKWGLSTEQQKELQDKLRIETKNPEARVKGQVQLNRDVESGGFQIISATLSDNSMATSILNGRAPTLDGGKVAVATRLTADGAQLLSSSFEKAKSIADLSIQLNYVYSTNIPAFEGRITYHWDRIASYSDSIHNVTTTESTKYGTGWVGSIFGAGVDVSDETVTTDKFQEVMQELIVKKCIEIDIRESGLPDNRIQPIRDAFMDLIVKSFTTPAENEPLELGDARQQENGPGMIEELGDAAGDVMSMFSLYSDKNKTVSVKDVFKEKMEQRSTEVLNINYSLPIMKEVNVVGNLASWYNGVRDNESCVNSVNLNDPFFQHRDIRFIMDLEGKEMFEEEINYVTINARKKRAEGNNFEDRVTMDLQYFNENGIQAAMQYARGEDKNPEAYEYQVQWSLRGGNVYPLAPTWTKGEWEGVTLVPPLQPKVIEFEADPEELKNADLSRVTLQVRYMKFGVEVEENIPLSVAKKEDIVSAKIFMDRDTQGYAYRLVYNHKKHGKLATEFTSKVNDYYVYASVPEDFEDQDSAIFRAAKEEADKIIPPDSNGRVTGGQILDAFKDIFGKKGS